MIPLTNKEIKTLKRQKAFCCCFTWNVAAICIALHGVISSALLPLTVRGQIGGQYGVLMTIDIEGKDGPVEIFLENVPFGLEMFVISLLFIGHLIGFYNVLKKSAKGMGCYVIFRFLEMSVCFVWSINIYKGKIQSHTMSQISLGWYCSISLAIQYAAVLVLLFGRDMSFKTA